MVAEEIGSDFESGETTQTKTYNLNRSLNANRAPRNGTRAVEEDFPQSDMNYPDVSNNNIYNSRKKDTRETNASATTQLPNVHKEIKEDNASRRRKSLPEKVFIERESLMTEMLQVKEYQGLYNIFVAITINLLVYVLIWDIFETGTIDLGVRNLMSQFGKPLNVLSLLVAMHLSTIVIYYSLFHMWCSQRPGDRSLKFLWDLTFGTFGVIFFGFFFYIPIKVNWADPLPAASAAIVVLEQLRLLMKMYSFARVNVPRALSKHEMNRDSSSNKKTDSFNTKQTQTSDDDNQQSFNAAHDKHSNESKTDTNGDGEVQVQLRHRNGVCHSESAQDLVKLPNGISCNANKDQSELVGYCPELSKFTYFLYAPTLIYRDSYPRTKEIRWNFVLRNIGETLGCILLYNLIHRICGFVLFENFGLPGHSVSVKQLISYIFTQMIPGGVGYVVGFFILLHTWQNIFAELLRFGDRMFYKDWWNSDSFSEYYRLWNIPVHDFLYTYIYKESKDRGMGTTIKAAPALTVFVVSSLFHEYILIYVLRFCYPVLLVAFGGFGVVFAFIPNRSSRSTGNVFIWWALITGKGLILSFYIMEYFARINNCPAADNQFIDFFLPRSWTCGAITLH